MKTIFFKCGSSLFVIITLFAKLPWDTKFLGHQSFNLVCKSFIIKHYSKYFFKDLFILEKQRERAHVCAHMIGEGQRERERRDSQADSLPNVEPHAGLDLMTMRAEPKSRVGC